MNLGFTGTRHGLTHPQRVSFSNLLVRLEETGHRVLVFRHGSCQGADVEAALATRVVCGSDVRIIAHPGPDVDKHQVDSGVDDEKLPGKTHFARNRDIVACTDALVACPHDDVEQPFGGTWYTVRHALKKGKRVYLVWPGGEVTDDGILTATSQRPTKDQAPQPEGA
jgi:hypothetical protein